MTHPSPVCALGSYLPNKCQAEKYTKLKKLKVDTHDTHGTHGTHYRLHTVNYIFVCWTTPTLKVQ